MQQWQAFLFVYLKGLNKITNYSVLEGRPMSSDIDTYQHHWDILTRRLWKPCFAVIHYRCEEFYERTVKCGIAKRSRGWEGEVDDVGGKSLSDEEGGGEHSSTTHIHPFRVSFCIIYRTNDLLRSIFQFL